MESKICIKCGLDKPVTEYHKNKGGKFGVYSSCKVCKYQHKKRYIKDNIDAVTITRNKYREKNRVKTKERKRLYYKNNKELFNQRQKNYNKKNPHYVAWRSLLYSTIQRLGGTKEGHTIDLLGYSAIDLKKQLESLFTDGMSWGNYGEWHIDHIRLVSSFSENTPMSIVNELPNLRPMWATTREINGILYEGNLNRPKK